MHCIAICNEKGGAGKTTFATNLATAWHQQGRDVLLVDADPQQTALDWSDATDGGVLTVQVGTSNLEDTIPRLASSYDLVVIDCAPRMGSLTATVVRTSDLVVIPIQPSAADIWSAETVVGVCESYNTPAVLAVSRQITGTNLAKDVQAALESFGLPVLEARTAQRVAYAEAIGQGKSVLDLSDKKARDEITSLAKEIITYLSS